MGKLNEFLKEQGLNFEHLEQSLEKSRKSVGWLLYTPIRDSINEKIAQKIDLSEKDVQFLSYGIDNPSTYDNVAGLVAAVDSYNMDNPDAFIISSATHEQLLEYITLRYALSEASIMLGDLCKNVHKQNTSPERNR